MKNDNIKSKIGFIFVLYQTSENEVERLKKEVRQLTSLRVNELYSIKLYFIDNTLNNQGYAYGINLGLKKAIRDGCNLFIIANPDISLKNLKSKDWLQGLKYFDILGLVFKQNNKIYYGGKIDSFRMSGGLIETKPEKRFIDVNFVSGSLMIIKKEVIDKIGFFDEGYFMYYEDVDYCFRAKKAGFKIGIDSKIFYEHFELSENNPKKEYFLFKNRWRFFLKYSNFKQKIFETIRLPLTLIESIPVFINYFAKSSFLRDFFSLNFSTLLNKIFHFLLFIFLIRNLTPEKYGIYTLVWAYIGFFNPFLDLGTTNYGLVYLPKNPKIINKLISLRFFITFLIFFIANFFAFIFFKEQNDMFKFIFLASLSILSSTWSGSYLILNAVKGKVIYSSILSLLFNILFCGLIFGFYLLFKDLSAIFYAIFLSFLIYLILTFYLVKRETKLKLDIDLVWWKEIILKSLIFVLISFFAGIRYKIEVFLLNFYNGSGVVGLYSSGYKFLEAGILIAGSYNIISMPKFSQLSKDLNFLKRKIKKDILFLFILGLVIFAFFYLLADIFLPILFGEKYLTGIKIAKIILLSLPFIFINTVLYNFFYGQGKEKTVLFLLIFQAIFSFIFNFFLIQKFSLWSPVFITIFSELLVVLIGVRYLINLLKNESCR